MLPPFSVIQVAPFTAILIENWNAIAHRYFFAYRALGDFRHVLGLPVVDEFATFSTPIFFGPIPLLGQLYNVGITLGHNRDPEMGVDLGWPPICVGIESDQNPVAGWEEKLLNEIKTAKLISSDSDNWHTQIDKTDLFATSLPLLPRQLKRICQNSTLPFAIAFSTGNRISGTKGKLLDIEVSSEQEVDSLIHKFSTEKHTS